MVHRLSFEAVDRAFCDIMNVPNSCMVLHLSENMRVDSSSANNQLDFHGMNFGRWTLSIGNGTMPARSFKENQPADWVEIPEALLIQTVGSPVQTMATEIYTDFQQRYHNISYLTERSIITPTNRNVTEINAHMLALVPGTGRSYYSSDTLHTDAADSYRIEAEYPTEFLNGLSFNGYPEHNIELKVFTPVMLLRNLNPAIGLCNGTRLMVIYLGHYVIRGIIMGGTFSGKTVAIPRIVLNINDHRWPFVLKRRQFPVRLCYAMTINKSQGQTLQSVGVYLPKPVFSHGQLYVAVSRVRSASGLRLLIINEDGIPSKYTRNIVYQEALADLLDIADVAQVCLVFHNFLF
ncbi:unnamed protein product [Linum tenue]|uniref:DNA helicase Pif1-like 2B domain-containing protein n=1 Tax=Linum tenue TaxID=586396 RepID=A0AAV0PYT3_9ROSI|nr:unnamed protein product [Linum tenue]